jgi:hypothetical protein
MIETSCKETRCICLKAKIVAELNTVSFRIEKLGSKLFISKETNNFTTLVLASTPLNVWALVYL